MLDRRRSGLRATRAAADVRVARVLGCADMGDRRKMGVARPTGAWTNCARAAAPRQLRAKHANNNVTAVIGSRDVESSAREIRAAAIPGANAPRRLWSAR
jgi:hypothetical protein